MRRALALFLVFGVGTGFAACAGGGEDLDPTGGAASSSGSAGGSGGGDATVTVGAGGVLDDGGIDLDATGGDSSLDPDAACATALEEAETTQLPVDIIWMVDNSASMAPAVAAIQAGLNSFAALIESKNLDYRVVMLSLRSPTSPITVGGKTRYPICIPPPLSGDSSCGDGPNFIQSHIDILSTQPLEQFLGTLGQTNGYQPGDAKGGTPWAQFLRPEATKTIVIVTDDNTRLSATQFETFPGGMNPFNSLTLPPGILDPSWGGLFDDYLFSGIYGWGSLNDPSVMCTFPDNTNPASSGATYTTMVQNTGGVRAQICDSSTWTPFFDAVAAAISETSKLTCELSIPAPSVGTLDYAKVNVQITGGAMDVTLPKVTDASQCGTDGGWYYDDPLAPTKVILCPTSCDEAQLVVGPDKDGTIAVLFGCETIVK